MPRQDHHVAASAGAAERASVIAFLRRTESAPVLPAAIMAGDRPSPTTPHRSGIVLMLLGSLAVHAGVVAAFNRAPRPLPSAGIPAIQVDIVLGDNAAAGLGTVGRESATELKPTDAAPIDEPVAAPRAVAEAVPAAAPDTAAEDAAPVTPALVVASRPGPDIAPTPIAPERMERQPSEVAAKPVRDATPRRVAVQASPAAGGIGRGGAAMDAGYHGRVAAHLARHKRFPPAARRRRQRGSVGIDFAIDGRGRVTMVRIARSSGVARLDRAAEAMVWRASPFPAPPDHRPQRFSVPISYSIR